METPDDPPMPDAPVPDHAAAPRVRSGRRLSRRRVQALVGLSVLILFALAGILLAGGPDGDRVETSAERGTTSTTKATKSRGERTAGAAATGSDTTRGGGAGSASKRDARKAGKGGDRAGSSGKRAGDKSGEGRSGVKRGGDGKAGEAGTSTSSTTAPPAVAGAPSASPDPLPAFALLSVRSSAPCPVGTPTVSVELLGVGGTLDGALVATRQAPVAPDGTWSLDPFAVPAVGSVDGVSWAATAERLDVYATCSGGTRSSAAPLPLGPVTNPPSITQHDWDGTTVRMAVTGCPTEAVIELFVGSAAPVPGPDLQPTTTGAMAAGTEPGTWSGSAEPTGFDPDTQGLWATAACRSEVGGTPVWHYEVVPLDPP